jgi:glutathione S-transferase
LWLLEELGLEYELKTFKRNAGMRAPPELKEVHPLGKSPVITVQAEGAEPITIAESGAIVEYLIDHYGKDLVPQRYAAGKEGPGLETEEWLRYRQFMHYAEGTIMPYLLIALVINRELNCAAA